jgi:hypothetical protein
MKKILLLSGLLTAFSWGYAQDKPVELGLQVGLNLASNSVESNYFENSGTGIRLSGGLVADIFLAERYAFSTGVRYTIKRSSLQSIVSGVPSNSSYYNLQTLQLPVTLKLFTSEISQDTRMYFQLGGALDIKLAERPLDRAGSRCRTSTYRYQQSLRRTLV